MRLQFILLNQSSGLSYETPVYYVESSRPLLSDHQSLGQIGQVSEMYKFDHGQLRYYNL